MVFLWQVVYWAFIAIVVVGGGFALAGVPSKGKFLWEKFISFLLCLGGIILWSMLATPSEQFVQIGTSGSKIVIDGLTDNKVMGNDIHVVNQDHTIVFTQNPDKIGKFRWAFGWREYRSIKDDVKSIVGEWDGLIYFVSKSTGKVKTMKK